MRNRSPYQLLRPVEVCATSRSAGTHNGKALLAQRAHSAHHPSVWMARRQYPSFPHVRSTDVFLKPGSDLTCAFSYVPGVRRSTSRFLRRLLRGGSESAISARSLAHMAPLRVLPAHLPCPLANHDHAQMEAPPHSSLLLEIGYPLGCVASCHAPATSTLAMSCVQHPLRLRQARPCSLPVGRVPLRPSFPPPPPPPLPPPPPPRPRRRHPRQYRRLRLRCPSRHHRVVSWPLRGPQLLLPSSRVRALCWCVYDVATSVVGIGARRSVSHSGSATSLRMKENAVEFVAACCPRTADFAGWGWSCDVQAPRHPHHPRLPRTIRGVRAACLYPGIMALQRRSAASKEGKRIIVKSAHNNFS